MRFTKIRNGNLRLVIDLAKLVFHNRRKNVIYLVAGPCQLAAIYLRFLSKKRIVIDSGWPLSDSIQDCSKLYGYVNIIKNYFIDFISMRFADLTICESQEQFAHVNKKFRVDRKKLSIGYTGINENDFNLPEDQPIELENHYLKNKKNVVLFRGKINPDAGIGRILELIKLSPNLTFIICSTNFVITDADLTNLLVINRRISAAEMHYLYSVASLAIGQFGEYPRLERTIPHKAFEAAFFGLPYLSNDSRALRELFPDENHALLTNENSGIKIAKYLNKVINDHELLIKISQNSKANYKRKFSQEIIACDRFVQIMNNSSV